MWMTMAGLSLPPSPSLPATAGLKQMATVISGEEEGAERLGHGTTGTFLFHIQGGKGQGGGGVVDKLRFRKRRMISRDSHSYPPSIS